MSGPVNLRGPDGKRARSDITGMAVIVAGLALIARSYRKAAGASAAAKRLLAGRLTQNGAPDGQGFAAIPCCAGAGERAEA
jgi:hypothetical protein